MLEPSSPQDDDAASHLASGAEFQERAWLRFWIQSFFLRKDALHDQVWGTNVLRSKGQLPPQRKTLWRPGLGS